MLSWALNKFSQWALSKNAPGSYAGEDDTRWAYTITTGDSKYLTRILLSRLLGLKDLLGIGVYIHNFHREDIDQHLHNHPWGWAFSVVLSGSYTEERMVGLGEPEMVGILESRQVRQVITDVRRVRFFNRLTKNDYHKVLQLHGDVWTLFITGPRIQDWGFLVNGRHIPWKQYLGVVP